MRIKDISVENYRNLNSATITFDESCNFIVGENNLGKSNILNLLNIIFTRRGFVYDDFNDFCERNPGAKIYMATTKAHKTYTEVSYEPDCYIMFGKESAGIPEEILVDHEDTCVRIPMIGDIRSLNLSNSVAIVLYEALRQNNFDHMNQEGHLHRLEWHDE